MAAASPSPRLPPFSIGEFNDLVTAALAIDSGGASSTLSLSLHFPGLGIGGSFQRLPPPIPSSSSSSPAGSRLKTFVRRPMFGSGSRSVGVGVGVGVGRGMSMSMVSVFSSANGNANGNSNDDELDVQSAPPCGSSTFAPYLPLATQYQRRPNARISGSRPASSIGTPPASESTHYSFPSSHYSYPPPSPTASVFSSNWHASASASDYPSSFETSSPITYTRPWSVLTLDRELEDPFAKGAVRVVHRSCEALPSPSPIASSSPQRLRTARHRAARRARARARVGSTIQEAAAPAPAPPPLILNDWTLDLQNDVDYYASSASTLTPPPRPSNPIPSSIIAGAGRSHTVTHAHSAARRPRASSPFPLTLRRTC
ncbi:hypothetical protein C8F01DRAFT_1147029 [Mycena amicta]|nr:hypothetical protein C8F01DRAFT_1147029 [Mycena amicta]